MWVAPLPPNYNPLNSIAHTNHWYIVVELESEIKFKFEGICKEGNLVAEITRFDEWDVEFRESRSFATHNVRMYELMNAAEKVQYNGTKYNLLRNNCQMWAYAFLELVSPKVRSLFDPNKVGIKISEIMHFDR